MPVAASPGRHPKAVVVKPKPESIDKRGHVLMVSAGFPPTMRVLKLAKHLPAYDWLPHFLAPAWAGYADTRFDPRQLPAEVSVARTFYLPALSRLLATRHPSVPPTSVGPEPARGSFGLLAGLARSALLWLNTPDELVGWLPFALWRGFRVVRSGRMRVVFASGPPFTTVLVGALLKQLTGRPFVADFRDAWVLDASDPCRVIGGSFRASYGRTRIKVLERLERYCTHQADLVLFTSDYTRDRYCERYPFLRERCDVIWNGAEESDFTAPPRRFEQFTFTYVGSLHEYQLPQVELFLKALRLGSEHSPATAASRVLFAGHRGSQADAWIQDAIRRAELQDRATLLGPLPHDQAAAILKGSGAVLLFVGDNRFVRLTKISDAAAVQRPMLAFAPEDSETARHVRALGQRAYSGDSPEELAIHLDQLAREPWSPPPALFPFPVPHPLNWRTAAQLLAGHLDRLAGARSACPD
jgi:glycosyltransferase involved in cell wall biosynthesis